MLMLYFSGTGNSKYIAELFCKQMDTKCHSIEEEINFSNLITENQTIAFCYPIYASRPPRIIREFALKHKESLRGKKIIIFCTQWLFSGDGARSFTDFFPDNYIEVLYAEHFLMPNNVSNLFFLPVTQDRRIKKYLTKADQKMKIVCRNIKSGVIRKRGFNLISRILGLSQGTFVPWLEQRTKNSLKINKNCNGCKICIYICPVNNLAFKNKKTMPIAMGDCIICYRCVNQCPKKAITVMFRSKVRRQYKGIDNHTQNKGE